MYIGRDTFRACGYYLFGLTRLGGRGMAAPCSYCMSGGGGGIGGGVIFNQCGYYMLGFQNLVEG